jgi:hypothetical protein
MVALDDLSQDQVKVFATAKGIRDAKPFLDGIERLDAWSSTTRPQDLEDVISLWIDKGRIGTRLEIMKNSVDRRLKERDQERAEAVKLSDEQVHEGVLLVAAAATLSQTQIIGVPDGADTAKGLSPKAVLTNWADAEIAGLLSRPIFDEAIYGSVRFHHRSAREYLMALWLARLLEKPASRRAIEALLFKNQYGIDVVVPTMRPVLPWLCIFDGRIRERVRKIAPEVIFEGGDPNAAIPKLSQHLGGLADAEQQTDFAMRFTTKLWGGRRAETFGARNQFRMAEHLKSLYVLLHQYIRKTDDIHRAGTGVFSPGLRDDAQDDHPQP